ncbi:YkyA family protein [Alkalihalophilus pseudofirmus]|uniref:YkyA family protein n=1 Tax=Alkalihalophilus pseudofirmus TaxID=79885 RepID=A0AAJ2U1E8_ALKPS|nr:YkyA family protein [Alkalihalophilus pseudofirmus]MDV2885447.1 YkyA family protein [Alkalihalophilus pseudofirmus]WEG15785.1 YkyA family protein [Alkalihalophilus pseudofirmus]
MFRKRYGFVSLAIAVGLLAGCGSSATETIYEHLESAVELEEPFVSNQQALQEAEEKEYELYEQMITMGTDDLVEIEQLADEAITSIEQREELIEEEKESIEQSKEEFDRINEAATELDQEELVELVTRLEEEMNNRFDAYHGLYTNYIEAMGEDRTLFELLKDEELSIDELQAQINTVNEQYEVVEQYKESFNEHTQKYNQLKRDFYEKAELEVQYEE